jgi:large subunit ribosomal protein L9
MPKTEIILVKNVIGLGAETDQVKVSSGYARNFLIPEGLAIPLTGASKRRLEVLRQRRAEREAQELNTMSELGRSLSKVTLNIVVKTGDDGKMFGSVTAGTVADALKTQLDVALDKRKIHLERAIHALGEHEVELRLHPEVKSSLKLIVKSATPLPENVPGTTGGTVKSEKRGKRPGDEVAEDPKKAKDGKSGAKK